MQEILNLTPSSAALEAVPEVDALLIFLMIPMLKVSLSKQQL
jgi:hypothetical protein